MKTAVMRHSASPKQGPGPMHSKQRSTRASPSAAAHRRAMRTSRVVDVCLAVIWAALIPGLMWLGAASGF